MVPTIATINPAFDDLDKIKRLINYRKIEIPNEIQALENTKVIKRSFLLE
ncbi:hypothetical protein [Providencia burhodogranariea]|nr:hypothetical protein [Providencia burhodogranariea]